MKRYALCTLGEIADRRSRTLDKIKRVQVMKHILAEPIDKSAEELIEEYKQEGKEQNYLQECVEGLTRLKSKKGIEPEELAEAVAPNEYEATDILMRYVRADAETYPERRFRNIKAKHDRNIYKMMAANIQYTQSAEDVRQSIEAETEVRITEELAKTLQDHKEDERLCIEIMAKTFLPQPKALRKYMYHIDDTYTLMRLYHERD